MNEAPDNISKLAFALSGAISAGAYTAGVLDYFFQALEAWEKERGKPDTPQHKVVVQAVTGASAGAITGALGAIALARGFRPRNLTDAEKQDAYTSGKAPPQNLRCILPSLYETWVVRPRMVDPSGGVDLLSAEDLAKPEDQVVSLLNGVLLDDIKNKALMAPADDQRPATEPPYPYVAENLQVYITVSNLRGIPFTVDFGNSTYGMQTHGDRAHFIVSGLGAGPSAANTWLAADSGRTLRIDTLPQAGQDEPEDWAEWDRYGTCALASSAFPVGLAPRTLSAKLEEYNKRSYPAAHGAATIKPSFPLGWTSTLDPKSFVFLNVDGGVVNNNPFDYAQYALMGDTEEVKTDAKTADRAVIMVSPFPAPPAFLPDGAPPAELVSVLKALFPALIDQAQFKPAELIPAMNPNDHSRFLIAPERNIGDVEQRYAIACGLLGGFGGFLDEKFRAHDFQLGRRNCQEFLRSTFGVDAGNSVVAAPNGQAAPTVNNQPAKIAVVPLLGDALPEVALPPWPRMKSGRSRHAYNADQGPSRQGRTALGRGADIKPPPLGAGQCRLAAGQKAGSRVCPPCDPQRPRTPRPNRRLGAAAGLAGIRRRHAPRPGGTGKSGLLLPNCGWHRQNDPSSAG